MASAKDICWSTQRMTSGHRLHVISYHISRATQQLPELLSAPTLAARNMNAVCQSKSELSTCKGRCFHGSAWENQTVVADVDEGQTLGAYERNRRNWRNMVILYHWYHHVMYTPESASSRHFYWWKWWHTQGIVSKVMFESHWPPPWLTSCYVHAYSEPNPPRHDDAWVKFPTQTSSNRSSHLIASLQ